MDNVDLEKKYQDLLDLEKAVGAERATEEAMNFATAAIRFMYEKMGQEFILTYLRSAADVYE